MHIIENDNAEVKKTLVLNPSEAWEIVEHLQHQIKEGRESIEIAIEYDK
ncbi:hypothetical protein [Marinomonas transparens]|uniref:Uncharacterized protein n=1 Tax=Marinomonas transparens TaxID=2795388 RepID=A0A934JTW6_9GAMM|nr:hypothetical protein [Marinomonas transparens]MBJ7536967.1 hypothetical protein [Marinomonas transparens]